MGNKNVSSVATKEAEKPVFGDCLKPGNCGIIRIVAPKSCEERRKDGFKNKICEGCQYK